MDEDGLAGKVAVVAGGAKNLGGLISTTFGRAGAKVVVHYHGDHAADDAAKTVSEIKDAGSQAFSIQGELTQVAQVRSLFAAFTDGYSTYAGSKAPVEHFTRAAAKEFAARGISVNNVAPGPMDTPFFYGQETPERVEFHKSQALGNQLTRIEDIVPLVRFLATDGHWITGQTTFANGGYTTR
jgi:NAD(P)-dependent dehydrogenase (short-subunit alcohol dehydrogenase family)